MKRIHIPLVFVVTVIVATLWGCGEKGSIKATVRSEASNDLAMPLTNISIAALAAYQNNMLVLSDKDTSKRTEVDTPLVAYDFQLGDMEPGAYILRLTLTDDQNNTWDGYYQAPDNITDQVENATQVVIDNQKLNHNLMISVPVAPR